ncbi:MAG TPA: hypothetical protein VIN09_13475 [Chloroflexota bacterium]
MADGPKTAFCRTCGREVRLRPRPGGGVACYWERPGAAPHDLVLPGTQEDLGPLVAALDQACGADGWELAPRATGGIEVWRRGANGVPLWLLAEAETPGKALRLALQALQQETSRSGSSVS